MDPLIKIKDIRLCCIDATNIKTKPVTNLAWFTLQFNDRGAYNCKFAYQRNRYERGFKVYYTMVNIVTATFDWEFDMIADAAYAAIFDEVIKNLPNTMATMNLLTSMQVIHISKSVIS